MDACYAAFTTTVLLAICSLAASSSNCNLTTAVAAANLSEILRSTLDTDNTPSQITFSTTKLSFSNYVDLTRSAEQFVAAASVANGSTCPYGSPCALEGRTDLLCQTQYSCTYDINRFPQYLCRASCNLDCNYCPPGYRCEPNYIKMPILRLSNPKKCDFIMLTRTNSLWSVILEDIAVSCACRKINTCLSR